MERETNTAKDKWLGNVQALVSLIVLLKDVDGGQSSQSLSMVLSRRRPANDKILVDKDKE